MEVNGWIDVDDGDDDYNVIEAHDSMMIIQKQMIMMMRLMMMTLYGVDDDSADCINDND